MASQLWAPSSRGDAVIDERSVPLSPAHEPAEVTGCGGAARRACDWRRWTPNAIAVRAGALSAPFGPRGVELALALALLLLDDVAHILRRARLALGAAQRVVPRLESGLVEMFELGGVERQVDASRGGASFRSALGAAAPVRRRGAARGRHDVAVGGAKRGRPDLGRGLLQHLVQLRRGAAADRSGRVQARGREVGRRAHAIRKVLAQVQRIGGGDAGGRRRGDGGDARREVVVRHGAVVEALPVLVVLVLVVLLLLLLLHGPPGLARHARGERLDARLLRRAEYVAVERPTELVDGRLAPAVCMEAVRAALRDRRIQPRDLEGGIARWRAVALHVDQPRWGRVLAHVQRRFQRRGELARACRGRAGERASGRPMGLEGRRREPRARRGGGRARTPAFGGHGVARG